MVPKVKKEGLHPHKAKDLKAKKAVLKGIQSYWTVHGLPSHAEAAVTQKAA